MQIKYVRLKYQTNYKLDSPFKTKNLHLDKGNVKQDYPGSK